MKNILLILFLVLSFFSLSAQSQNSETARVLSERSIEYLYNEQKIMNDRILISYNDKVLDNPYFNVNSTKIINKKSYDGSFLYKDNLKKIYKYLKKNRIWLWKIDCFFLNGCQYVVIYDGYVEKGKKMNIRKTETIAVFKYIKTKDGFNLIDSEIN